MKKFIFNFVLITLSFGFLMSNSNANILSKLNNATNKVNSVSESINKATKINALGNITGGINQSTADLKGTVNLGAGIVSDFEDMWDTIEGGGVGPDGKFELPDSDQFNTIGENTSARGFLLNVLNFALSFLGIIAVAIIIYAGFTYLTSLGDDGQIESAKKMIIYSVIGILIILISFALVNTIIKNAGTGGDGRGENNKNNLSDTSSPSDTSNPSDTSSPSDTNTEVIKNLFGFNNGLVLSGEGVQDFGKNAVVSLEKAKKGINFGLTIQANSVIDFGDNTSLNLDTINQPNAVINHSFGEAKNYPIRVIAQTIDGKIKTFQKTLTVGGIIPKISSFKKSGIVEEKITFDASLSTVSIGTIKNYKWNCSGGNGCFSDEEGQKISVSFSEPGNYTISLEIETTLGLKEKTSTNISILGNKPLAEFTIFSTNNSKKPGEYKFDASNSSNILGETAQLNYKWSFDGISKTTSSPYFIHEFTSVGARTIELEVTQIYNGKKLVSEKTSNFLDVTSVMPVDFNVSQ